MMNWDYIGGFFDGEGSASTSVKPKPKCQVKLYQRSKDDECLRLIGKFLEYEGISATLYRWVSSKFTTCQMTQLNINGGIDNKRKFLKSILPHVIRKRIEVENSIAFLDRWDRGEFTNRRLARYTTGRQPLVAFNAKTESEYDPLHWMYLVL